MTFISILIPFKKGRRFLKDCLESVHEQGLDNFEIILIVNGADEDIDDFDYDKYLSDIDRGTSSSNEAEIDDILNEFGRDVK